MQQGKQTNKNKDGVLGIRTGVWFVMFVMMLGCLMLVYFHADLARPNAATLTPAAISHQLVVHNRSSRSGRTSHSRLPVQQLQSATSPEPPEVYLDLFEQMSQDRRSWVDGRF
jgi:hypothetical protein